MTGFGSAEGEVLGGRLSIEIRSVNHRYFNPQLKLPFELGGVEGPLRERLRQLLERGHVTVSARWIEAPQRDGRLAGPGPGAPARGGGEGAEEAPQAQGRGGPRIRGPAA